jgi:hypothetical protein
LNSPDTPPLRKSRILSLALSGRPVMVALPRFERGAIVHKVVEERVWEAPQVTACLKAVNVPLVKATAAADQTPDMSRARGSGLGSSKSASATVRRA